MTCLIDSGAIIEGSTGRLLSALTNETNQPKNKVEVAPTEINQRPALVALSFKPEEYVAFQMSFVPEQRGVFVSYAEGVYDIVVFVDKRDLALNRRIFEREREIMHFYRQYRFDLSVIPLMGRRLSDIPLPKGKQVLQG